MRDRDRPGIERTQEKKDDVSRKGGFAKYQASVKVELRARIRL